MPADIKACIESWHKYLPDYKFINWNDSNFDWNISGFTKHCREHNLYAFCSDYIRFWALYNYGGIYLDSDVLVKKSFDSLLNLDRIISKEVLYTQNDYPESAILGCKKGDPIIGEIVKYYNNITEQYSLEHFMVSPHIMQIVLNKYDINYLDCNKYFNFDSEDAYAQHQYKNSWMPVEETNCLNNDNIKIFLCAHKPIENYIPENKKYVILDVSGTVKDNFHDVIDISKDEFIKEHNVCYSEGCAMYYLYKHPEIIPDYICFGHYRRYFMDFVNSEKFMPRVIDAHGAIVQTAFDHETSRRKTNIQGMYQDHQADDIDAFIESVKEAAPEYWDTFNDVLNSRYQLACNIFAMKKEHFLEMCEMCFKVLNCFDKKMNYKNNDDVLNKMKNLAKYKELYFGVEWQARLQGFLLEWLTESYYRQKFGFEKCYQTNVGTIEKTTRKKIITRTYYDSKP